MKKESYFWEHEAYERFKHPACVTNCILKTTQNRLDNGNSVFNVTAYGFRAEPWVTYVT